MDIPIPSIFKLLLNEILHPFFLFQVYSVIVWMVEEYYLFSFVIIGLTLYGTVYNVYVIRANLTKMREMAFFKSEVTHFKPYYQSSNSINLSFFL